MTPPVAVPLLLRQRVVLGIFLVIMVGLSWAYLIWMAADMAVGSGGEIAHCAAMPGMTSSNWVYVWWLFVMWAVMAVAMMLPTSLPLIFLFGRYWKAKHKQDPVWPTLNLVFGYLSAWFLFGVAAALLQWGLEHLDVLTPVMGEVRSPVVGGAVILFAGLFQFSPLKTACLSKCRTPMMFLNTKWRNGKWGPFIMGFDDGLYCLGCCWAMMLIMFVSGVMNLFWMAVLTVFMISEKIVPHGLIFTRVTGAILVAVGIWRMVA